MIQVRKMLWAAVILAGVAGPARAEDLRLKPLVDLRLRHETVEQDDLPERAEALTLRMRAGLAATRGRVGGLVEAQATLRAAGAYNDGLHGPATRPLIADPENIALYRAELQYRVDGLALTAGRQRIALGDERFVGGVGFRQNGQTFDAVRVEWQATPRLKADMSYAWGVRTIWGIEGRGLRQQAIGGDNVFANLGYVTPVGTVTGFAYLVDQDEAAVQNFRLSSQSYGIGMAGSAPLSKATRFSYRASYARQFDWGRNPADYAASYYLGEGGLEWGALKVGGGLEVLGADRGAPLTSFQTPLATLFKFQGWVDKFLATPPDGVRDFYASAGVGMKRLGPASGATIGLAYHRFESDRLDRHYGDEFDVLASGKLGRTTVSARYAQYRAEALGADTRKFWLQLDWQL